MGFRHLLGKAYYALTRRESKHYKSVRHAVSDETILAMSFLMGRLQPGQTYNIREGGRLVRKTVNDRGPPLISMEDLGPFNSPKNLRKYYRDRRDASLRERLRMTFF
jgi:hypothetical protein